MLSPVNDDALPMGYRRSRGGAPPRTSRPAGGYGAPLIGIACDGVRADMPFDGQHRRHAEAVERSVGGIPVLVPNGLAPATLASLVMRLDGLILPGAESDPLPAPHCPTEPTPRDGGDAARAAAAVQMIQAALSSAVPLLGICGGLHEINVAFDGTLNTALHDTPGMLDHRAERGGPADRRHAPKHEIRAEGDRLREVLGASGVGLRPRVNSLHARGIDRLAPGLTVEARAPDGVVEAVSIADAPCFALAVQWNPEWDYESDPVSAALYAAFADALVRHCREGAPRYAPADVGHTPAVG